LSAKNIIKSLNLFSSLNEVQIEQLSSISTIDSYDKNYILHYEKKQSSKLLFLINGLAKAYKIDKYNNEIFLHYVHTNTLLSDISTIHNENLSSFSNIEIMQTSKILSIDYHLFKEYFLNKNILCLEFMNEIILKTEQLQGLINREFLFDSIAKVAMMIYADLDMFNNLKRHDISLILHIQPATLSRVLNRLKRNNIIDIIHGKVIVLDFVALESIYKE